MNPRNAHTALLEATPDAEDAVTLFKSLSVGIVIKLHKTAQAAARNKATNANTIEP